MKRTNFLTMLFYEWFQRATRELETVYDFSQARLLARLLLDAATKVRFAHLMARESVLPDELQPILNAQLSRVKSGEPLRYVLGSAPFFGREWHVERGVLIPRPETELLVEAVLEHAPQRARVAELGTGSGIIAGTLALERSEWKVCATELSPIARAVAARNFAHLNANVELLRGRDGDWLGPIRSRAPFSCVVSNPPYIASRDIENLQVSVRDFEPRVALDGGEDGLAPYRQIAAGARELLSDGGFLALEVGADQKEAIEKLFFGWLGLEWKRDLQGIARTCLVWK